MQDFLFEIKAVRSRSMRIQLPLAKGTTLESCLEELKSHLGKKSVFVHIFLETESRIKICGKTVEFYPPYGMEERIQIFDRAIHAEPLVGHLYDLCAGICTVDVLPTTDNRGEACTMVIFTIGLKGK